LLPLLLINNSRAQEPPATRVPGVLQDTSVHVMQEVPTKVILSSTDINRITCPNGSLVKDVVYSSEKGVSVKIEGSNAFVKFLVVKDTVTGRQKHRADPVEFYVICEDNQIFTLIGTPQKIPARHIQLVSSAKRIKKNLSLFEGIPFEKKVIMITQKVYTDDIPESFTVRKVHQSVRVFKDIDVVLNRVVMAEGEGVRLKEYVLSLKDSFQGESIELAEKSFLVAEFTENPVAIALETHTLRAKAPRRLFILERTGK
jgi:conjugal transfer pilus assembly protein TraK